VIGHRHSLLNIAVHVNVRVGRRDARTTLVALGIAAAQLKGSDKPDGLPLVRVLATLVIVTAGFVVAAWMTSQRTGRRRVAAEELRPPRTPHRRPAEG
jgi:hypothetical protein